MLSDKIKQFCIIAQIRWVHNGIIKIALAQPQGHEDTKTLI